MSTNSLVASSISPATKAAPSWQRIGHKPWQGDPILWKAQVSYFLNSYYTRPYHRHDNDVWYHFPWKQHCNSCTLQCQSRVPSIQVWPRRWSVPWGIPWRFLKCRQPIGRLLSLYERLRAQTADQNTGYNLLLCEQFLVAFLRLVHPTKHWWKQKRQR